MITKHIYFGKDYFLLLAIFAFLIHIYHLNKYLLFKKKQNSEEEKKILKKLIDEVKKVDCFKSSLTEIDDMLQKPNLVDKT
jgi:hypothetical protein